MQDKPKKTEFYSSIEKGGMISERGGAITKEERDEQTRAFEEDAKKPLSQRKFLDVAFGTIDMYEFFFNEDLEKALIHSDSNSFLEIRAMICKTWVERLPEFDPIFHLQDVVKRVKLYIETVEVKHEFQRTLYNNTASIIVKRLNKLINSYELPNNNQWTENIERKVQIAEERSPDELQPKIYIPHTMQTRLYKTLSDHTPKEQHEQLELLLNSGASESRIWVKLKASSLAYVFKQARESGSSQILADMKETAKWLSAYFSWGKTSPKVVSPDTSYKVLRGNTIVDKTNQIRLKA